MDGNQRLGSASKRHSDFHEHGRRDGSGPGMSRGLLSDINGEIATPLQGPTKPIKMMQLNNSKKRIHVKTSRENSGIEGEATMTMEEYGDPTFVQ